MHMTVFLRAVRWSAGCWAALSVEAQHRDPASSLTLCRAAVGLRGQLPPPDGILSSDDPVRVTVSPDGLLLAERGPAFTLAVAMGSSPVPLPPGTLLLASAPLAPNGQLPPDTAAWLHRA